MCLRTEDVGEFKIDGLIFEWIGGVEESFSYSVEFDGVGGFVDSIVFEEDGFTAGFFCPYSGVFLVHVFDMSDGVLLGA